MQNENMTADTADTTTLNDLYEVQEARLEYCYDMGISIEDADL